MVVAPLLDDSGDLGEGRTSPPQEHGHVNTRRDLRLAHTCDCFDRFCGRAPPAMSITFWATPSGSRPGSAARLHVLARPLGKGGEAAGNEGIRCGDGGLRVRTEIGMRLEVLEHLARLLGAGEEAVIDLRRDPYARAGVS